MAQAELMDIPTPLDAPPAAEGVATRTANRVWLVWFGGVLAVGLYLWCITTKSFIADDSYFYVVIARNIALHGQQTFSGLFPTNGFHPLWGYVLAAYTFVVHALAPDAVNHVTYALPLAIVMLAATGVQTWRFARALDLDPLVITAFLVGYVLSLGVLYSEGPLFLLLLVSLLAMMARDPDVPETRPVAFGLLTGAVVLSRLDSVFLVGFIYLYYLWKLGFRPRFLLAGVLCGAVVGGYVLSNLIFFGGAMPISGWLKGNFPHPFIRGFVYYPFPRVQLAMIGGYSLLLGWMPLVVALVTLATCRPMEKMQRVFLLLLLAGSSVQGFYIALFTRSHTLWPWYYVMSLTLLAISLGIFVSHWRTYHARAVVLVLISLAVLVSYRDKTRPKLSPSFATIDRLEEQGINGQTVLVSDWPGAVAFYTDNHIVAADMLTSNRFEFERMRGQSNALDYLFAKCKELGKPIEHIMLVGESWLTWDAATETITYFDPRRYPILVPIGSLKTHFSPSGELECEDGIDVWFGPLVKPPEHSKGSVDQTPEPAPDANAPMRAGEG